jgi:hypothetical protein
MVIIVRIFPVILSLHFISILLIQCVLTFQKKKINVISHKMTLLLISALWLLPTISVFLHRNPKEQFLECMTDNEEVTDFVFCAIHSTLSLSQYKMTGLINLGLFALISFVSIAFCVIEQHDKTTAITEIASESRAVYNNLSVEIFKDENAGDDEINRKLMTIIKVMALLFIVFWLPFSLSLLEIDGRDSGFMNLAATFIFAFIRGCINPIICICLNKEFRVLMKKVSCC